MSAKFWRNAVWYSRLRSNETTKRRLKQLNARVTTESLFPQDQGTRQIKNTLACAPMCCLNFQKQPAFWECVLECRAWRTITEEKSSRRAFLCTAKLA